MTLAETNKSKIFVVDLEAVETRYTAQWKTHFPKSLKERGHDVQVISGPEDIPRATTPGAFLNFGGTNIYKSVQVEQISRLFCAGSVHPNDHFIFTDAWHPGIINLKYMSELLQIPVTIHALWHAGSYDPQDFLGRMIGAAGWVRHAEMSFFNAIDHNYFATDFHIDMFSENMFRYDRHLSGDTWSHAVNKKIVRVGWPMEYVSDILEPYKRMPKRDLVLFPHRIAPEKQVEIFRDLKEQLPQYEFVVCQDQELTKNEYHNLLGEAKLVFSANLQETLGISCYEGAMVDAIPMVPDRLSYKEMYSNDFKYPSTWTENWDQYVLNKQNIVNKITDYMENYEKYVPAVKKQTHSLAENFFNARLIYEQLK